MNRMTIDERVREAVRVVAEAFRVPEIRVEAVAERLAREALEQAFGDNPRAILAEELAGELRAAVEDGLGKVKLRETGEERPVIFFPKERPR